MTETVRFLPASPGHHSPAAVVHGRASALPSGQPDQSLDSTLAFVERAAEALRSLQSDNEAANRQLAALRDQLQRERQARQADSERFDEFVKETQRKVTASEAQTIEAKALAIAAIKHCEEMTASEAKAKLRAKLAEDRATELQQALQGLQKAIAFEFSSVLR